MNMLYVSVEELMENICECDNVQEFSILELIQSKLVVEKCFPHSLLFTRAPACRQLVCYHTRCSFFSPKSSLAPVMTSVFTVVKLR